jgi:hypothetical protein
VSPGLPASCSSACRRQCLQHVLHCFHGDADVIRADVKMRDGPEGVRAGGQDTDAEFVPAIGDGLGGVPFDLKIQNIGLDGLGLDIDRREAGQTLRQRLGMGVVFLEAGPVVFQGVKRARRSPRARATATISAIRSSGQMLPPPRLWVFSRQTSFVGA